MYLSTNLPTSLRAYDVLPGESSKKLPMNVSGQADAEFMRLLKRDDPERYHRLARAMEQKPKTIPSRRVTRHYVSCLGCGEKFLAKRANNTTCSAKCRRRASRRAMWVSVSQIPANHLPNAAQTRDLRERFLHFPPFGYLTPRKA